MTRYSICTFMFLYRPLSSRYMLLLSIQNYKGLKPQNYNIMVLMKVNDDDDREKKKIK